MKNPETNTPENPTFETIVPADIMQELELAEAATAVPKNAEEILESMNPEARDNAEKLLSDFGSVPVKPEVQVVTPDTAPLPPPAPVVPIPPKPKAATAPIPIPPAPKPADTAPKAEQSPTLMVGDKLVKEAANSWRVKRIDNRVARYSRTTAREELKNRNGKIESNSVVAKSQEAFDKAEQNLQIAKEALSRDARKERANATYDARVDTLRQHFTKDGVLDQKRFEASLKGLKRISKKDAKLQARTEFDRAKRMYETKADILGNAERRRRSEIKSLRWYRNTRFNALNRQGVRYNGYIKPESSSSETGPVVDLEAARKAREAAEIRRLDADNARVAAKHKAAKNTPAPGQKPQSKPKPQAKPTPKAA